MDIYKELGISQYAHGAHAIFQMAVGEQKKINADSTYCQERIKAYRIALAFLRPDLTSEQIYNEIERISHLEWDPNKREYV